MAINERNFRLNSNFPTDNVVYSYSLNLNAPGATYIDRSVNHSLPFTPLVFGLYSTDGGTTWSQLDFQKQSGTPFAGTLYADGTKVYFGIYGENNLPAIRFRIFGFAPSTYSGNTTAPTPLSNFYINTTMTHDTLIAKGTFSLTNTNSLRTVYTHSLGYLPRVMMWLQNGSTVTPYRVSSNLVMTGTTDRNYAVITSSALQFYHYASYGLSTETLHYRIYGGQNG